MGVGPGFAIAASLYWRDRDYNKRVVCVEGDSAIGFSAMELETAVRYHITFIIISYLLLLYTRYGSYRYRLPIIFFVMNNSGIGFGTDKETFNTLSNLEDDITLRPVYLHLQHTESVIHNGINFYHFNL